MKKFMIICGCIAGLLFATPTNAQVSVNVNLNLQPNWGPAGYDYVTYYYLPDLEIYYYVPSAQYIYLNNGRWIWSSTPPGWCRNYDFARGYKVVINEDAPYHRHKHHQSNYAKYRKCYDKQKPLKFKHNGPAKVSPGHMQGKPGKGNSGNGHHGNGNGHGNGHKGKGGKGHH